MDLKVLSWNIWIDGYFDKVADFLKKADADIIGLQEVEDDTGRDVIGFLAGLGYGHVFASVHKVWGDSPHNDGPAVFSKYPIVSSETYLLSETDTRAAARADIEVGGNILHVFSTHLLHTHQKPSDTQALQASNLLKEVPDEHSIVMGDFNATPESAAVQHMRTRFVDSDPSSAPTWSVYPEGCGVCKPTSVDTCLDYIFTTKDIAVHSFVVGKSDASDHLPISTVVTIP